MNQRATVSVVMALFNKESAIATTLSSIFLQEGRYSHFDLEVVLVDDCSTDDSVKVAEARLKADGVRYVLQSNHENLGPSVRLNQAVKLASGDYIFVFDADDIAPKNIVLKMLNALEKHSADYVYARSKKTTQPAIDVIAFSVPENAKVKVSDRPVEFMLRHHIVHPVVVATRSFYLEAGGAYTDIFIQDEGLALRLALAAKRACLIEAPGRYVLKDKTIKRLSSNIAQQHHDQYRVACKALQDDRLPRSLESAFIKKIYSSYWKSNRLNGRKQALLPYFLSRMLPKLTHAMFAAMVERYFSVMVAVRR
ncbi:MAG: glycosyltransferase family 2 protein [Moraxellaceae bacterium]|nr:glycosyltransferase family 2 protein [Moraxellaceae bacterium]MDZ4386742.1 glycosyltransferase family 2 protein [Moraxellaceae bacterium]